MITFWELIGICIIFLFKYKDVVLNLLEAVYKFLLSPPPVWTITNQHELTTGRLTVGETVRVDIKYVKDEPEQSNGFAEALVNLRIEITQNLQQIIFLKEVHPDQKLVTLKFSVQKSSAVCNLRVLDQVLPLKFLPGPPDPEKFRWLKPLPIIKCITFETRCIKLQPRDKFENVCSQGSLVMSSFKFLVSADDSNWENEQDSVKICTSIFVYPSDVVYLNLTFYRPGIFNGTILYNDIVVGPSRVAAGPGPTGNCGKFSIASITNAEETSLQHILTNSPGWKYHEGKLLVLNESVVHKSKKVYVYISQRYVCVQEYILKFIPVTVARFRVNSMTKFDLLFTNDDLSSYTFSIHDGIQPKVTIEMNQSFTRIVYAMFTHFLQLRYGSIGSESFADKQNFFYTELNEMRSRDFSGLITFSTLYITRGDLLNSSMQCTYYFHTKDWCKHFRIEFIGEAGIDGGGLRREWFDLICCKLFDNDPNGLFCSFGNSRLVHPNPSTHRDAKYTKKHYEFAGRIVGKGLIDSAKGSSYRVIINGRFTRSFFAQILGLRPNYKHFEQDDPELYLSKIKFILEHDVESMELTFSEEEYRPDGQLLRTVDLVPNGSKKAVTNDNKEEYLNALANYRLGTKVKKDIEAFVKGLHELVPDELLSQFDENELELLMCGKSEFDVDDLKKHYDRSFMSSMDPSYHRILEWFWISVTKMNENEKAKLLQFITGSSLLPNGGFAKLRPKVRIVLDADFGRLPTAQTCANQICLSDHDSFESFEKSLLFAINEGSQGFGFR